MVCGVILHGGAEHVGPARPVHHVRWLEVFESLAQGRRVQQVDMTKERPLRRLGRFDDVKVQNFALSPLEERFDEV